MARSNSPSDSWVQLYQQSLPPATATSSVTGGVVSDSTIVSASQSTTGAGGLHGSRPIRRRSRASRRTPTTVLNTDPTNFRAMVQQFTGGYANATSPYPVPVGSSILTHPPAAAPSFINFGVGDRSRQPNVSSETAYRQFLQMQFQQQQQQQQQHRPRLNGQGSDDAFLMQRIRNFGSDVENNEHFGH